MTDYHESITSKLCAFARAWHSNKVRNKIFDDYLAYDFMGMDEYQEVYEFIRRGFKEDGELSSAKYTESIVSEYLAPIPLSRAGFCESRLESFAKEHGEIQYVILGAGNDTFSFRCDKENIRIFEIDHPVTQASKLRKIRNLKWNVPNNVRFVQVDFEKEHMGEKLLAAGFGPEKKVSEYPAVKQVYYPGLPTDKGYEVNRRQAKNGGAMISFELRDNYDIERFFESLKLITLAESLGGVESLVCHPSTMTHASIPEEIRRKVGITDGLIRLSIGIENIDDILADLKQAIDAAEVK